MTKFPLSPAVGGLPTFYGAYLLNKQRLTEDRGWNEMTLKEYESSLVNIICPNIKVITFDLCPPIPRWMWTLLSKPSRPTDI